MIRIATGEQFAKIGPLTFHWWRVRSTPTAKREWLVLKRWSHYYWDGNGGYVRGFELGLPKLLGRGGCWTNLIVRWA